MLFSGLSVEQPIRFQLSVVYASLRISNTIEDNSNFNTPYYILICRRRAAEQGRRRREESERRQRELADDLEAQRAAEEAEKEVKQQKLTQKQPPVSSQRLSIYPILLLNLK